MTLTAGLQTYTTPTTYANKKPPAYAGGFYLLKNLTIRLDRLVSHGNPREPTTE